MSIDRGIDKEMWRVCVCVHTIEYYGAIKNNEIRPFAIAGWT